MQAEAAASQSLATAGSYGPGSMQRQMSLGLAGRRMSISSRSAPPNLQPSSPPGVGSSGNLADAQQAEHNGAHVPSHHTRRQQRSLAAYKLGQTVSDLLSVTEGRASTEV